MEEVRGIRIEDNIQVLKGGCNVLSHELPKTVNEIEAMI